MTKPATSISATKIYSKLSTSVRTLLFQSQLEDSEVPSYLYEILRVAPSVSRTFLVIPYSLEAAWFKLRTHFRVVSHCPDGVCDPDQLQLYLWSRSYSDAGLPPTARHTLGYSTL